MNIGVIISSLLLVLVLIAWGSTILIENIDFFSKHTGHWKIPGWRSILTFCRHESSIDGGIS